MPIEIKQSVIDAAKKNGRDYNGDIIKVDGVTYYVNIAHDVVEDLKI